MIGPDNPNGNLHVTLSSKGELLLGARVYEKLGKPTSAVLLYDKLNSVIGIRPSHERAVNAYPFKSKPTVTYKVLRAYKFCRHFGIRVDRTIAFNMPEIDGRGMLHLDLKRTTVVGKLPKVQTAE